jgi:hypothetical protein
MLRTALDAPGPTARRRRSKLAALAADLQALLLG